jgi:uracil-DNA glycosylase family 4
MQRPEIKEPEMSSEPGPDCTLCPRLAAFRDESRARNPGWWGRPVPSFGDREARLLIVGLAPGLQGANRTGRPFTGDFAGDLLFRTLSDFGWSRGVYGRSANDGLTLSGAIISNAVRCVPPENKPTPLEIRTCRPFLRETIRALPRLRVILALGRIAHDSVLAALEAAPSRARFGHGARHEFDHSGSPLTLFDSYHCSRYNTSTGRLTEDMFRNVFEAIARVIPSATGGTSDERVAQGVQRGPSPAAAGRQ